jgi:FkbM family methyltransferase
MPDLSWNTQMWDEKHDWSNEGEEWSEPWGGAEPQWFGTIYPRIHRFLPAPTILEIATGYGRWTKYLIPQCSRYLGVDLSSRAIKHCKNIFSSARHAYFVKNDGMSIEVAKDREFDLVFSFDSLVHVEADVMISYISQTIKKLGQTGAAFFHHSNVGEFADRAPDPAPGFRARSVSAEKVRGIIEAHGGRVLVQEMINWGGGEDLPDCMTLFARSDYPSDAEPVILRDNQLPMETRLIKEFQSPYSRVAVSKTTTPQHLNISVNCLESVKESIKEEVMAIDWRLERDGLKAKIAELEAELAARPQLGTEAYDLAAAQRVRDRMARIQPHMPRSTSGVFSFSQHQQELFVLETLDFKRDGFFLEIGVATGIDYSNTYMLETKFGWKGILCEPNPSFSESIRANRSAVLDTRAAYSTSGETVRFLCVPGIYGTLSTISDFSASDYHNRYGEEIEVQTVSLEDLLTEHNAPRKIDYMSLDTEGSETLIIKNFDFDKRDISILTIEHNMVPGRIEEFDQILVPFGYKRVLSDFSAGDAWYVKERN